MDKRFPEVVNIGGRKFVKNSTSKAPDNRMRLKETVKSLGRAVQKSQLSECVIDHGNKIDAFVGADIKVVLSKSSKPVAFLITGKSESMDKDRYKDVPSNLEETVKEINKMSIKEPEEADTLDVD